MDLINNMLVKMCCWFIPGKKNRRTFRIKHPSFEKIVRTAVDEVSRKMSLVNNDNIWELPNGIKFFCPLYPWDIFQRDIVNRSDFVESDMLYELNKYIPNRAVILDIGANIGNHSVFWAMHGAKKIYAFEPVHATYRMLLKNIEINQMQEIIIPQNIALGDEKTSGEISSVCTNNIGGTSIKSSQNANNYSLIIERLDNINLGEQRIDFCKIDVEGFEKKTLNGMKKTLQKYKPVVFIESWEKGQQGITTSNASFVKDFFRELGYDKPVFFEPWNYLFIHKDNRQNGAVEKDVNSSADRLPASPVCG